MKKILVIIAISVSTFCFAQEKVEPLKTIFSINNIGTFRSTNRIVPQFSIMLQPAIELVVVAPWFWEAIQNNRYWTRRNCIGVQLTLVGDWRETKWRPLTTAPGLTDKYGFFYPHIEPDSTKPGLSLKENKWSLREIENEFRAQIELACKAIPIDHITQYNNSVSFDPQVEAMVRRLADEYNLIYIDKHSDELEFVELRGNNSVELEASFNDLLENADRSKVYVIEVSPMQIDNETSRLVNYSDPAYLEKGQTMWFGLSTISGNMWRFVSEKEIAFTTYNEVFKSLPRSTPERENVDAAGIRKFTEELKRRKMEIHSLVVLRHGNVIHEEYFNGYNKDRPHIMYSVTKTYTAIAAGFAVAEKRIKLNDKVISFFPDLLPEEVSPNLKEMTVKDLLTMTAGNKPRGFDRNERDWVKQFLSMPVEYKPGTRYAYCNIAPYVVSAIIQKVTGEKMSDYLYERLFRPLGMTPSSWNVSSEGITYGGFDLYAYTEDMAKLGQLMLQKGEWNGKQILPASWIEMMTSKQVETDRSNDDWNNGYGFYVWRGRHNSFRADGASGQYILVLPDQDAVIAVTAKIDNMGAELNLIWENILPALK